MWTRAFWQETVERSLRTAAQAIIAVWAVGDGVMNALEFDLELAGGVALGGFVITVLTCIVAAPIGVKGTPSATADIPVQ